MSDYRAPVHPCPVPTGTKTQLFFVCVWVPLDTCEPQYVINGIDSQQTNRRLREGDSRSEIGPRLGDAADL